VPADQEHTDKASAGFSQTQQPKAPIINGNQISDESRNEGVTARIAMGKSPGEVAFFKLLHAELQKAQHFFGKAEDEFTIREERVREGMAIMKKPNSIMLINDRWNVVAKSLYRLYKDLLLLETFAIMTYCSFSKILKKHDKVTGYNTRSAFMKNVVDRANFTNYPRTLVMIQRIERLYEEVSELLAQEGKQNLYEDERLFINMIHQLNEQAMNTAEAEGAPDVNDRKEKRGVKAGSPSFGESNPPSFGQTASSIAKAASKERSSSSACNSLRAAVQHNEWKDTSHAGVEGDDQDQKPRSFASSNTTGSVSDEECRDPYKAKKQRLD
jgi:hypothetical protein